MKLSKSTCGPLLATIATLAATISPALASETTVIETVTTTKKVVLQGSVATAPMISVEGLNGKTAVARSPFPNLYLPFTSASGITIFFMAARDDLNMRRDELLARVMIEKADGAISADESSNFISRLEKVDGERKSTPTDTFGRAYFQHVGNIYRDYDHIAQDLEQSSNLTSKQLDGRYSYFVY
jgi:hypothetical protein